MSSPAGASILSATESSASPSSHSVISLSSTSNRASTIKTAEQQQQQQLQPIPKKLQQIKTDKPRPHVCQICTRGFARLEHLKRHERSHTNEKPFQCAACGRCFARRDLVLRHQQKLHLGLPIRENNKDENEHVIVLNDNTSALAPLPQKKLQPPVDAKTKDKLGSNNESAGLNFDRDLNMNIGVGINSALNLNDNSTAQAHHLFNPSFDSAVPNHDRRDSSYQDPITHDVLFELPQFPTPSLGGLGNSPPRSNSTGTASLDSLGAGGGAGTLGKPNFRASYGGFPASHIPSPLPTSSSHNTPGRNPLISPDIHDCNTNGNATIIAPKNAINNNNNNDNEKNKKSNKLLSNPNLGNRLLIYDTMELDDPVGRKFRHNLYSAASAMLYVNNYDANLIQNMQFPEVPLQVEFLTPQLHAIDDFSLKNSNLVLDLTTMNVDWNIELLNLNQPSNQFYLVQLFLDPSHPHHIKGTTPMTEMRFDFDPENPETSKSNNTKINSNLNANVNVQNRSNSVYSNNSSVNANSMFKKQKLHLDDFLRDIMYTEFDGNFPSASHHVGFGNLPADSQQSLLNTDEIQGLFRKRQLDLITGLSPTPLNSENSIITDELRSRVILEANISEQQFPPTIDLQNYMKLYEKEYDACFPFVHLPLLKDPIVDNFDNLPLVLAMTSIGALYLFHDRNALLLFNLLKLLLNKYFERELVGVTNTLKFKKVSITTHQCLVLHIFITIFINQDGMADSSARLITSMARLVHLTGFDKPLELLLVPPEPLSDAAHDPNVIRKNYDYFIMAQLRVRTLHTFYLLQVFRAAVLGQPVPMLADALSSGLYCMNEDMWKCANLTQWFGMVLSSSNIDSVVSISNLISFSHLLIELHNHYSEMVVPLRTTLSILFYIHQKILGTMRHDAMQWRFQERPQLEALLKSWELLFIKAGGVISVTSSNQEILKKHNELKIILPSYYYAKLKLCVNIVPILQNVWSRNWDVMNRESFGFLSQDPEALLEATQLAVDIVNVWIHNISVANDAKSTSLRTPVFFVTVVFAAILVISHFLNRCEQETSLSAFERLLWLKCESIIRQSESVLSYDAYFNNDKKSLLERDMVRREIQISGEVNEKVELLKLAALSLEVGTRILTDAPVWPLSMRFAEALKQRRNYVLSGGEKQSKKV